MSSTSANSLRVLMIPLEVADYWVNGFFTLPNSAFAHLPKYEVDVRPGLDHDDLIAGVEQELKEIDWTAPSAMEVAGKLQTELLRLRGLPSQPAVKTKTDKTIGQYWRTLDDDGKRAYLLRANQRIVRARGDLPYWDANPS